MRLVASPLYSIGPLISNHHSGDASAECLKWLDKQPRGRVVFLSFGSRGAFSREQLQEIAVGLEKSGQRFLWVVRELPSDPKQNLELDSVLPEGFMKRTHDRGLVVKSWAPQVAVLRHPSTGGFITHCGWNSVLEAICAGVPMIAWPLYAEQRQNRHLMVSEEMRITLPMKNSVGEVGSGGEAGEDTDGISGGRDGEGANDGDEALRPGGSSLNALTRLLGSWKEHLTPPSVSK